MADAAVTFLLESLGDLNLNLARGVPKEIINVAQDLKRVRDFLYVAEKIGYEGESAKQWMWILEETSYEMEDVLDECYALLKLRVEDRQSEQDAAAKQKVRPLIPSSFCMSLKRPSHYRDIASKIVDVKGKLDKLLKDKDLIKSVTSAKSPRDPSTRLADLEVVHGRDADRDILVDKLVGRPNELGIEVVSIVGIGGLGKTTLARLVYNDSRVKDSFDLRVWVCVSDPFDLATIAKEILGSMRGQISSINTDQLDVLLEDVRESISGYRFLLVLHDVWSLDYGKWIALESYLRYGGAGSKVLVTTRNRRVAEIMDTMDDDIHSLGKLTDEECWLILCRGAFPGRNKDELEEALKDVSERISKHKCYGLPLVAEVLGGLLYSRSSLNEWEEVLNTELWQLEEAGQLIFHPFLLSYNKFSPMYKRCFLYCAIFPKGSEIYVEDLIGNWMALGFLGSNTSDMELKGRECFDFLARHFLFQDLEKNGLDGQKKSCKMPDIVHDFAQYLRRSGRVNVRGSNITTCGTCDAVLLSTVSEFYSLFRFDRNDAPPRLCSCLKRLRVLSMPIDHGLRNFRQGLKQLIHLRWLKLDGSNLSVEDLKIIFKLYCLQTLLLRDCKVQEIPSEIGNLIHLRRLDLSDNEYLKELPESMGRLKELRTLDVRNCPRLIRFPEEMHGLINLRHLHNDLSFGVNGLSNLGLFENMNLLSGTLRFKIRYADDYLEDVVKAARDAKLRDKIHIERLVMVFEGEMEIEGRSSTQGMHLIDALEPHPELESLEIWSFNGPNLPHWIVSGDLQHLMKVRIVSCDYISSLRPLAKLPWLEEIEICSMRRLQFVGREFFGITTTNGGEGDMDPIQSASTTSIVAFPQLKKLTFDKCPNWKEWEDITTEEEESEFISLMPCLTHLTLKLCPLLVELPRRLLRKASSTSHVLNLSLSEQLQKHYEEEIKWKSW